MSIRKKRRVSTLKEQVFKIARGTAKILAILPTLETKEDARKKYSKLKQDIWSIKGDIGSMKHEMRGLATREELVATKEELKEEINTAVGPLYKMFQRHGESHKQLEAKVQNHEHRLAVVENKF